MGALKNFAKFTEKYLCQRLFYNKAADLRPATFIKRETLAQVFSREFCEIFNNNFLQTFSGRLLPYNIVSYINLITDTLSGLKQFLVTESPLK